MAKNTYNKNTHNGHAFVDLGLPSGLLWATCNVGASLPEQAGLYFAWGETEGFTAEQVARGERKFFKQTYKAKKICTDLSLEQDAAHAYMGGKWRMPAKEVFQELIDNCDIVWTTNYDGMGVAGMLFTSKINGNSAFFPANSYCYGSSILGISGGYYWSSTRKPLLSSNSALLLLFHSCDICAGGLNSQFCGHTVRAVYER